MFVCSTSAWFYYKRYYSKCIALENLLCTSSRVLLQYVCETSFFFLSDSYSLLIWRHRGVTTTDASRLVRSHANNSCRRLPKHTHTCAHLMRTIRWVECARDCVHTQNKVRERNSVVSQWGNERAYEQRRYTKSTKARTRLQQYFPLRLLVVCGRVRVSVPRSLSAFSLICVCCARNWQADSRWKIGTRLFVSIFLQAFRCERHLSLWRRCREWTSGAPLLWMKMDNIFILIYALGWVNAFYEYQNRACTNSVNSRFSWKRFFFSLLECYRFQGNSIQSFKFIGRSSLICQPSGFQKMFIVYINNDTVIINNRECAAHNNIKVFDCVIVCACTPQFS